MHIMKPGDIVDTPHGRGWLLHPIPRAAQSAWIVMIGTKGYIVSVEQMLGTSQDAPSICPQKDEIGTSPEDMSTAGTRQMEMIL